MPVSGYTNGLFFSALVAVLLVPAPYYVTDLYTSLENKLSSPTVEAGVDFHWLENAVRQFPPVDLCVTSVLLTLGVGCYLCEWLQRKLMERRITKLNKELMVSVERLQKWDLQQEQLEATLKMVHNATSEYNLLLYLLLRQHRCLQPSPQTRHVANCLVDKDLDEDVGFLAHIDA